MIILVSFALFGALTSCGSDEAGTTANEPVTATTEVTTTTSPTPVTTRALAAIPDTTRATTAASTYFANCTDAKASGAAPLRRGDPGYRSALDRDGDGIACET